VAVKDAADDQVVVEEPDDPEPDDPEPDDPEPDDPESVDELLLDDEEPKELAVSLDEVVEEVSPPAGDDADLDADPERLSVL